MNNEIELEDEQFYRVLIDDEWLVGRWNEEGGGWFDVLGAFRNTFGKYGRCEMQEIGERVVMPDEHELEAGVFYRVRLFGSDDEPGDWTVGRWDGLGYGGGWTILDNPLGLSVVKIGERIAMPDEGPEEQRYAGLAFAVPFLPDGAPQSRTVVDYDPSVKSAGVFNSGVDDEPDGDDYGQDEGEEPHEDGEPETAGWRVYDSWKKMILKGDEILGRLTPSETHTTVGCKSGSSSVDTEPGTKYTIRVFYNGVPYHANVHGGGQYSICFGDGKPSTVMTDEGEFPLVAVDPDAPAAPEPAETPPWLKYRDEPR